MKKCIAWKNNGTDLLPVYDFSPPKHWTDERIRLEQEAIRDELKLVMLGEAQNEQNGWSKLASLLPCGLRKIIWHEVSSGNMIVSIGMTGWPNSRSIVVNLRNRFQLPSRRLISTAHWRRLDDSHYCSEEISEVENNIEHLIIV